MAELQRLAAAEALAQGHQPHPFGLRLAEEFGQGVGDALLLDTEDPAKSVRVRAELTAERLVVEVSDEGLGFDLVACTADPTAAGNIMREDGRGLFLMQKLMTRVERFTDGGNVVRLVLHRG